MAAIKIGELLIREGLITPAELEEALKTQVIFGGRLGTNLIEMGLLEEDDIARVLSRKLKVPFAGPEELLNIPPKILALVPRELAERHKVIPLRLENRRLTLAMANPADLQAADEIAFRTGFVVRPVVAPEVRLIQALENYYQVARDLRYIAVQRLSGGRRKSPQQVPAETPADHQPLAVAPLAPDDLVFDLVEMVPEEPLSVPENLDLDEVARRLADAASRDDIADLAIRWSAGRFQRAALFLVRPDHATGWRGSSGGQPAADFDRVRIPLNEPSVLKTVAETRSWYLGPLPRAPFNSLFIQELGGEIPATALLMPLLMMGRVIAILYVDGRDTVLQSSLQDLQKLTAKMVMAFEILILKNKILVL